MASTRSKCATPEQIEVARRIYGKLRDGNEIEIDDCAAASRGEDPGTWVAAWVWLSDSDMPEWKPNYGRKRTP